MPPSFLDPDVPVVVLDRRVVDYENRWDRSNAYAYAYDERVAREWYERGRHEERMRNFPIAPPRAEKVEIKQVHLPVYLETDERHRMQAEIDCLKKRIEFWEKHAKGLDAGKASTDTAKKSAIERAERAEKRASEAETKVREAGAGDKKRIARALRVVGVLWRRHRRFINERASRRGKGAFAHLEIE